MDHVAYVEQTLHLRTVAKAYPEAESLPLLLRSSYQYEKVSIAQTQCLFAMPVEPINLTAMRKHQRQLTTLTSLVCVLCFTQLRAYTQQKLLQEGIPFILLDKMIYVPFLGTVIANQPQKRLPEIRAISAKTQKLLLTALYQRWQAKSVGEAAVILGVSNMTVTRCFDELDAMQMPLVVKAGRSRRFIWTKGGKALCELIRPVMIDPVARRIALDAQVEMPHPMLCGMSALCHYTMLADNDYRTYAVTKEEAKALQIDHVQTVPKDEMPAQVIHVMKYDLPFDDGRAVDPITAILSLDGEEADDPRAEAAIQTLLEEILYD